MSAPFFCGEGKKLLLRGNKFPLKRVEDGRGGKFVGQRVEKLLEIRADRGYLM